MTLLQAARDVVKQAEKTNLIPCSASFVKALERLSEAVVRAEKGE